jgi:hypothetical protein
MESHIVWWKFRNVSGEMYFTQLAACFAYSSILKMEAVHSTKMVVNYKAPHPRRQHSLNLVLFPKTAIIRRRITYYIVQHMAKKKKKKKKTITEKVNSESCKMFLIKTRRTYQKIIYYMLVFKYSLLKISHSPLALPVTISCRLRSTWTSHLSSVGVCIIWPWRQRILLLVWMFSFI